MRKQLKTEPVKANPMKVKTVDPAKAASQIERAIAASKRKKAKEKP
jgi:hypothetical protein